MSVEEMLCSLRLVESRQYDSPRNEVIFHFLPFGDHRRITSLPKVMKVYLLARVLFGLCCPFLVGLGQFVLHKCIPKSTLLLEVLLEVWHAALLYVVFVQVLLERLERNSHLLHDPILKDFFFVLWETEVLFDIYP